MLISDLSVGKWMLFHCSVFSLLTMPIPGYSGSELMAALRFFKPLDMPVLGSLVCKGQLILLYSDADCVWLFRE